MNKVNEFVNWPNAITALRIILLFPIVGLFSEGKIISASIVLAIAISTDFFDGLAARSIKHTEFGKIFDPFADKWLIQGTSICIASKFISIWPIAVSIGLDSILIAFPALNQFLKSKRKIGKNKFGETKMFFQCLAMSLLFLGLLFGLDYHLFSLNYHQMAGLSLWAANVFAVGSIIDHALTKEEN